MDSGGSTPSQAYKACLQVLLDTGMPGPAPVCNQVKLILKQVWKLKNMIPKVKFFIWRILRRAIPSGERRKAFRYSKHILQNIAARHPCLSGHVNPGRSSG
jgi:hypothetical protein